MGCIELGILNKYPLNHAFCAKKEEVLITLTHRFSGLMFPAYPSSEESEGGGGRPSRLSIELAIHAGD